VTIIRQKRRETEASKITEQLEKKFSRYEGYIDRLERKAGSQFQPGDEGILLTIL
jgi:breast cancer 2 susceptibility protein